MFRSNRPCKPRRLGAETWEAAGTATWWLLCRSLEFESNGHKSRPHGSRQILSPGRGSSRTTCHLNQLAILNGPHPKVFGKGFWRPSQLIRSWYMFFFQIPFVPELYTSKRYPKFMRKISTKHYVSKGKLSTEEIDVYSKVFDNR